MVIKAMVFKKKIFFSIKKRIFSLCVSVWLCGNVGESVCVYFCARVYACVRAREHVSVCVYLCRLLCVCMCACVRACACKRAQTHFYMSATMSVSNAVCILLKPAAFSLPLTVDRDISAQIQTLNLKQAPMKNETLLYWIGDHTTSMERDPPVGKSALTTEIGAWCRRDLSIEETKRIPWLDHHLEISLKDRRENIHFVLNLLWIFVLRAFQRIIMLGSILLRLGVFTFELCFLFFKDTTVENWK